LDGDQKKELKQGGGKNGGGSHRKEEAPFWRSQSKPFKGGVLCPQKKRRETPTKNKLKQQGGEKVR